MAERSHIDYEGASPVDLTAAGLDRYCENIQTRVWGFYWRLDDGELVEWRPGYDDPEALLEHIAAGRLVVAHNANFERNIWNRVMIPKYGLWHWPSITIEQQSCTLARAAVMNLPLSLDKLGAALGLSEQKDMEGVTAMRKLMRPRSTKPDGSVVWWDGSITNINGQVICIDDPKGIGQALLDRNMLYCAQDVRSEAEADHKLPMLTPEEHAVWVFDQTVNERGVKFDVPVVERAAELTDYAKKAADRQMRKLTGGKVKSTTAVSQLVTWLQEQGIACEAVNKGTFKEIIFGAQVVGNDEALAAINLRKAAAKTSTAKYKKILDCVNAHSRICFMLQYHGASTGRWAGRLVQPQNFPRFNEEDPTEAAAVGLLVRLLSDLEMPIADVYDTLDLAYGDVLVWLSKALRSMIVAEEDHVLMGGDFSNIEGRANAWIAGEDWKIEAFKQYDEGTGPDLYKLAYSRSFAAAIESITKPQRQIGKVQELALGYQGGVNAFLDMAENYGMEVWDLARIVRENAPPGAVEVYEAKYAAATDKAGLPCEIWAPLKLLVVNWREAHPATVQSWWAYQDACIAAIDQPGMVIDPATVNDSNNITPGRLGFLCDGNYLYIRLPSGRVLSYAQPYLEKNATIEGFKHMYKECLNSDLEDHEARELMDDGQRMADCVEWLYAHKKGHMVRNVIKHWGVNSYTKKWSRLSLYGGKICENIVQAIARDCMVYSMFNVEAAGFPIILTVHDEILAEVKKTALGMLDRFKAEMSKKAGWMDGLPIAVAAWEDLRYVK